MAMISKRGVLLVLLAGALMLGWQRAQETVMGVADDDPVRREQFVHSTAALFPGREWVVGSERLPPGLAAAIGFTAARPDPMGSNSGRSTATGPVLWLLGSGLRHHHAVAAITTETTVISFDAHADVRAGDGADCGSWLRCWLAEQPGRQAQVLGVSARLTGEAWQAGPGRRIDYLPLDRLATGDLQLWPVHSRRTWFRASLPASVHNLSVAAAGARERECWLIWRMLDEWRPPEGETLAITVDLDCLAERAFAGEWAPGELPQPFLLHCLRRLAATNTVRSVSICGFAAQQSATECAALAEAVRAIAAATEQKP